MTRLLVKPLAICSFIALSGCGTYVSQYDKLVQQTPKEKVGYIIGSYNINCEERSFYTGSGCLPHFPYMQTFFQNSNNKEIESSIGIVNNYNYKEFERRVDRINMDENKITRYFCKAIPEGEYVFYGVKTYIPGTYSGIEKSFHKKNHFSVPFSVEANAASYVGNFHHITKKNKNNFLYSVRFAHVVDYFSITDMSDTDVEQAMKKCPADIQKNTARIDVTSMRKADF